MCIGCRYLEREAVMGNPASNAYEAPREMDLPVEKRRDAYVKREIDDTVRHAKSMAKKYANVVLDSLEAHQFTKFVKSDLELQQVMAMYGVNKVLCSYA